MTHDSTATASGGSDASPATRCVGVDTCSGGAFCNAHGCEPASCGCCVVSYCRSLGKHHKDGHPTMPGSTSDGDAYGARDGYTFRVFNGGGFSEPPTREVYAPDTGAIGTIDGRLVLAADQTVLATDARPARGVELLIAADEHRRG